MKCIIIDDVPMARKGMRRLVEERKELELMGMFSSPSEAQDILDSGEVELVFLDIQMGEENGLELARRLGRDIMVVFTTAYSQHALEGYELNALDYLVKPIDPERFNMAVDKALSLQRSRLAEAQLRQAAAVGSESFITVKSERRYVRLRYDDILYVEGSKDLVIFQLAEGKVVTRLTIKSVEEMLPVLKFMRVNKSYIVNLDKITAFDANDIWIGNYEIAIGPTYRDQALKTLLA